MPARPRARPCPDATPRRSRSSSCASLPPCPAPAAVTRPAAAPAARRPPRPPSRRRPAGPDPRAADPARTTSRSRSRRSASRSWWRPGPSRGNCRPGAGRPRSSCAFRSDGRAAACPGWRSASGRRPAPSTPEGSVLVTDAQGMTRDRLTTRSLGRHHPQRGRYPLSLPGAGGRGPLASGDRMRPADPGVVTRPRADPLARPRPLPPDRPPRPLRRRLDLPPRPRGDRAAAQPGRGRASLLGWATRRGRHLTFRAAGTSLSGQAVSDDVLVEIGPFLRGARVLDDGARIWTPARGDRRPPEPPPGRPPDPHRARPRLDRRGDGRRHPRQQLVRHVLRGRAEQLPHPRLPPRPARRRRRGRHRAARRRRAAPAGAAGPPRRARWPCATRSAPTRRSPPASATSSPPRTRAATASTPSSTSTGPRTSSPTSWWAPRERSASSRETTMRTVPEPPGARDRPRLLRRPRGGGGRGGAARRGGGGRARDPRRGLAALRSPRQQPAALRDRAAPRGAARRVPPERTRRPSPPRPEDAQAILKPLPPARAPALHLRRGRARARSGSSARASPPRTGAMRPSGTAFLTEDVAVPVARLAEAILDCQAPLRAPRRARHRHLRPREGRQPALRDGRGRAQPRGGRALRGLRPGARGPRGPQVRRGDQGRARLGPQHGPLREDRVGRSRVRGDGAGQGACSTPTASSTPA